MKPVISIIRLLFMLELLCSAAYGQSHSLKTALLKLTATSDSTNKTNAPEKLYLQFDKPYYAIGDTIWFKAYLLNAAYLTASAKSGIMNIDIANDSNKVVKQYRIPIQSGLAWGDISLSEKDFTTGTYTIRAYTNWMWNQGNDAFFYKRFYISSANENNWLVNTRFNTSVVNGSNTVNAKLLFSDMNKIPFAVQPLQLQVMNGSKRLYRQKLQTGVDGVLDVKFNIPPKAANIAIIAESEQRDKRAVIPVALNRPENTDVQFLPEGGSLVAGLPAHIGFKAIAEDGTGTEISGIITGQNQQQAAGFHSLHNGMGSFDLNIKEGESYTARVTLPGGTIKDYPLPVVKSSGTVLNIKNPPESDSLEVSVLATNELAQTGNSYFLIGKARGIVCYAAIINFNTAGSIKRKIAKSLFPTGITHFILMTAQNQPLNERLVFIDHHDSLHIDIAPDREIYSTKDSIALHLKVTDNAGKPVAGNFSLTVTDDAQVKADTLNNNILTRLLLTSDLKGYVEQPGYYLKAQNAEALDNLLLTQGWISYSPVKSNPAYEAETEFIVKGNVKNVFGKPVKGTKVVLFSKSPFLLKDTLTDKEGKFAFHHFPEVDTPVFILKAVNKSGKSFNVNLNVDETVPPLFEMPKTPLMQPWYINSDTTLLNFYKTNARAKQLQYFPESGHVLKEVKITAKKVIKDSQNLNGPGNADVVIDEKELEKAGKKTFLDLLKEKIKGFREGFFMVEGDPTTSYRVMKDRVLSGFVTDGGPFKTNQGWYFIDDKPIKFIIDGTPIYKVLPSPLLSNPTAAVNDITSYLKSHSAEDIKGIEANISSKYTIKYVPIQYAAVVGTSDVAFIEITTRSGQGPGIFNTPGMYLYKPLPVSWPKQFYKPKYAVKDTTKDLRSTIDWEPNITTDANGKANLWFYSADTPSTYTLIMEGSDMNGNLGYKKQMINIYTKKNTSKITN